MDELQIGDWAEVTNYESLNGNIVKVWRIVNGAYWVSFLNGGMGIFQPGELTKINNPELWFGGN